MKSVYVKIAALLYIGLAGCAPHYGDGTRAALAPDRCDKDYCNVGKAAR